MTITTLRYRSFSIETSVVSYCTGKPRHVYPHIDPDMGPRNFRNLFMHAPGGKKDGLQLMPISEVSARDDFFNIKNVTRNDVLAAHRVPPQLLSLVPTGTTGFGSVVPAAKVFAANELLPLQARLRELNEWAGEDIVTFNPYSIESGPN